MDRPQLASGITFASLLLGLGSFSIALGFMPLAQAAWCLVFGGAVAAIINLTVLTRLLPISWIDILRALVRPMFGIVIMTAVLFWIRGPLWNGDHPLATASLIMVALVFTGALVYFVAVALAWRLYGRPLDSPEQALLTTVAAATRRRATT